MLQSAQFNAAEVRLGILQGSQADSIGGLQSLIGGAVVQELDAQIELFSADLTATNAEKQVVRNDIAELDGALKDLVVLEGDEKFQQYSMNDDPDVTESYKEGDNVVKMSEGGAFFTGLQELAKTQGVDLIYGKEGQTVVVTEGTIESLRGGLESKLEGLNSTSELKMIGFQSLMDARKQSMMMLSNMVNADNQTKMSIIQNMKG